MNTKPRGRPRKYTEYDNLVASLPKLMTKRPKYLKGVGVFRGARGETVWIKIRLPQGGVYDGKNYPPGSSLEIKLGNRSSWQWEQLEERRREMQGRADRGEPLQDAPVVTFQAWAKDWLERAKQRVRAYGTEEVHVKCHLVPFFGTKPLSSISSVDVNRWIKAELSQRKPSTVQREFNTLKAILNDAIRAGQIKKNPCDNADKIPPAPPRQRFLDGEEMLRLLVAANEVKNANWLPDFILWAIHSGMRKGEIFALEWEGVAVFPGDRVVVSIENTKSGQPRMVTATSTMKEVLERQKDRRKEGDNRVFPVSKMTLRRKWESARKVAGLEDVTVHDLRRTHSTYAAVGGVDLRTLAARIGHTDLSMLHKHYAALVGSAEAEAAERIEDVLLKVTRKSGEDETDEASKIM